MQRSSRKQILTLVEQERISLQQDANTVGAKLMGDLGNAKPLPYIAKTAATEIKPVYVPFQVGAHFQYPTLTEFQSL